MTGSAFEVVHHTSSAGLLHGLDPPEPVRRTAWVMTVDRPALVLGSSQSQALVDSVACAAAGVEVVTRRSGGGVVLLEPGAQAWVDLLIPAADPLWSEDVAAAFGWVSSAWQEALRALGVETVAHTGRLENGRWGDLVCFAGRGPGELMSGRSKAVGMSQRRTRRWVRFQTMALSSWDPSALLPLLDLPPDRAVDLQLLTAELDVAGAGLGLEASVLADALVAELARIR